MCFFLTLLSWRKSFIRNTFLESVKMSYLFTSKKGEQKEVVEFGEVGNV